MAFAILAALGEERQQACRLAVVLELGFSAALTLSLFVLPWLARRWLGAQSE